MTKDKMLANLPPPQFREYAYTVLVPTAEGWAGAYSAGPIREGESGQRVNDAQLIKSGQGIEGRITGGIVDGWDYEEAVKKIHLLHDQVKDNTVIPCIIRTMEPRDMR